MSKQIPNFQYITNLILPQHLAQYSTLSFCEECNSTRIYEDQVRGQIVCMRCGLVQAEKILQNQVEYNKRYKEPVHTEIFNNLQNSQKITVLPTMSPHEKKRMKRVFSRNQYQDMYLVRLHEMQKIILQMSDHCGFPTIYSDDAFIMFQKHDKQNIFYGKNLTTIAALLLSCIAKSKGGINLSCFCNLCNDANCYDISENLLMKLKIDLMKQGIMLDQKIPLLLEDHIQSIMTQLRRDQSFTKIMGESKITAINQTITEIINKIKRKNPNYIAKIRTYAPAVLSASLEKHHITITSKQIAQYAHISVTILQNRIKEVKKIF